MKPSGWKYHIVDAFTNRPFAGNPAAVLLLDEWREDAWLQNVAMEMNLSETAFLVPMEPGYQLRWFTPAVEVDLCGHATLASAAALKHLGRAKAGDEIRFHSRSGPLLARLQSDQIELDFPLQPEQEASPPSGLIEALGAKPTYVGRSVSDYLVVFESEEIIRSLKPDFKQLAGVPCRGVIVTSASADSQVDFVSRFFAPASGVDEDPVTGSAHCCLADYWHKRLQKTTFAARQISARGGELRIELRGKRVGLGGQAVVMAEGTLLVS